MSSTRSRPSSARSQTGSGSPHGDRLAPPKPPAISVPFLVPALAKPAEHVAVRPGGHEAKVLSVRVPDRKGNVAHPAKSPPVRNREVAALHACCAHCTPHGHCMQCDSGRDAVGFPRASGTARAAGTPRASGTPRGASGTPRGASRTPRAAETPRGALSPVTSPTSLLHPALMGVARVVEHVDLPGSPGAGSPHVAAIHGGGGDVSRSDDFSTQRPHQPAQAWGVTLSSAPHKVLPASPALAEQAKRTYAAHQGVDGGTPPRSGGRLVPRQSPEPRPSSHRNLHRTVSSNTLGAGASLSPQGVTAVASKDHVTASTRRLRSAYVAAAEFARSVEVTPPDLTKEGSLHTLRRQLSLPGPQPSMEEDEGDEIEGVRDVYVPTWRTFWPVATAADTGPPRHRSLYWQDFEWPAHGAPGRGCPHRVPGGAIRKACELCLPGRDVARIDHVQAYGHLRLICRDRISGVPVRGAAVRVDAGTGRNAGSTCGMASVTDVTGEVTVSVLAGRLYLLSASCTGYYPYGRFGESLSVYVEEGALYTVHVLMVPVRIGAILTLWEITPAEHDQAEGGAWEGGVAAQALRGEGGGGGGGFNDSFKGWGDGNDMGGQDGFPPGRQGSGSNGIVDHPSVPGGPSRETVLGWQPGNPAQDRTVILLEPEQAAGGGGGQGGGVGNMAGGTRQQKRAVFRARCMRNHTNVVAVWAEDSGTDGSSNNSRVQNGAGVGPASSPSNSNWLDAGGRNGATASINTGGGNGAGGGKQGVVLNTPQLAASPSQLSLRPLRRVCLCGTNEDGRVFFSGGQAEEEMAAQQRALDAIRKRQAAAAAAAAAEAEARRRRTAGEANAVNSAGMLTPATVALLERSGALAEVDTFDANAAAAAREVWRQRSFGHLGEGHQGEGVADVGSDHGAMRTMGWGDSAGTPHAAHTPHATGTPQAVGTPHAVATPHSSGNVGQASGGMGAVHGGGFADSIGVGGSPLDGPPLSEDPDAAHVLEYLAHVQVLPPGSYLATLGDPSLSLQFASRNNRARMEGMDLSRTAGRIPFTLVAPRPRVVTSRSNRFEYDADSLLVEDIYTDNTAHAFVGSGKGHGQYLPWDLFVRRRPRLRVQLAEIGQGGNDVLPWGEAGRFLSLQNCVGFRYSFVRGKRVRSRRSVGGPKSPGKRRDNSKASPARAKGKASKSGGDQGAAHGAGAASPRGATARDGGNNETRAPRRRSGSIRWEETPQQEGPVDADGALDGLWMDPGYAYKLTVVGAPPFVGWHVHVVVTPSAWVDMSALLSFVRRVPIKFTVYDVQTDEPVANARINVTVTVPPPPRHAGWVMRPQEGDGVAGGGNMNVMSPMQRQGWPRSPFEEGMSPRHDDPWSPSGVDKGRYESPRPLGSGPGSPWFDGFSMASPNRRGEGSQYTPGGTQGMGLLLEESAARHDAGGVASGRLDTLVGAWLDGMVREVVSEAVTEVHVLYTDEEGVAEVLVPPLSHVTGVLRVGPPYMVEGNDYTVRQRIGLKRETIHFRLQRVSKIVALCCDHLSAAGAGDAAPSPSVVRPRDGGGAKGGDSGGTGAPRGQRSAPHMSVQQPATIAGCSVVISLAETFSGETLRPPLELVRGTTRPNGLLPPMVVRAGTVLAVDVLSCPVEYCAEVVGVVEAEEAHVSHHKSKLMLLGGAERGDEGRGVPRGASQGAVSLGHLARLDGGPGSPTGDEVASPGGGKKFVASSREPVGRLVATTRDILEGPFYVPRHAPSPYPGLPPSLMPSSPEVVLLRRVLYEREVLRLLFRHKPWLYVRVYDTVSGEEVHSIDFEVWLRMDWLNEGDAAVERRADQGPVAAAGSKAGPDGLTWGRALAGMPPADGKKGEGESGGGVARFVPTDEAAQAVHANIIRNMYGGLAIHGKGPNGEFDPTGRKKRGKLKGVYYTSAAWEEEDEVESAVDGVYFRERRVLRSLDTRVLERNTLWFAPGANVRVTLKPDFPYVVTTVHKTLTVRDGVDCEVVELFLERDPDAAWFWLQHEGRVLPWSLLGGGKDEVQDTQLTARALDAQRREAKKRAMLMESVRRLVEGHHRMPRLKDVLLKWGAFEHVGGCERAGEGGPAGQDDEEHAVYCNSSFFTWRCKDSSIIHVGFFPHMVATISALVEEYRESVRGLELHLAYVQAKVIERPLNGRFYFGTAALHFNGVCVFAVDCSSAISLGLLRITGEEIEQLIGFWAARVQGDPAVANPKGGSPSIQFYITPRFSLLAFNSGGVKRWRNGDFVTASAASAGEARRWIEDLKPGGVTDIAGGMAAVLNTVPPASSQGMSAATSNVHRLQTGAEGGGSGASTPRGSSSSKIDAAFLISCAVDLHSHESVLISVGKQLREKRCHVHGTHLLLDNEDGATAALLGMPGGTPAAEMWERGEELLHRISALTGGRYHFVDCAHGLVEAMAVPKARVLSAMQSCRLEMEHLQLFNDAYKQELRKADLLRGTKLSLRGTFHSHYHTDNVHCDPRSLGFPKPQLHPNISPAMLASAIPAGTLTGGAAASMTSDRGESPSKRKHRGSPGKHGGSPSKVRSGSNLAAALNLPEDVLEKLERLVVPGGVVLQDREESLKWALERAFQEPVEPVVVGGRDASASMDLREPWKAPFSLRSLSGKDASLSASLGHQPSTARLGMPAVKNSSATPRPATASAARPRSAPRSRQEGVGDMSGGQ
eukprot:jgi/Mesvir1/14294/Mv09720-RA.1